MEVYKRVCRRLKHESLKKKFLEDTYMGFGKENVLSTELENDRMEKPFKGRRYVYNLL